MAIEERLSGLLAPWRSHRAIWREGIDSELEFWDAWARTGGLEWKEEFDERLDPDTPLQPEICQLLDPALERVRLLDVGSGPLTCLGKRWGERRIEITAIDPLAERYLQILDKYNLRPPVAPVTGEAERLREYFPVDSFDLVHARNCLDHSWDPEAAIIEMLAVVKPGSYVLLQHRINEGENVGYEGLHQWNFFAQGGEFHIGSRRRRRNISRRLRGLARVECEEQGDWIEVILQKPGDGSLSR